MVLLLMPDNIAEKYKREPADEDDDDQNDKQCPCPAAARFRRFLFVAGYLCKGYACAGDPDGLSYACFAEGDLCALDAYGG